MARRQVLINGLAVEPSLTAAGFLSRQERDAPEQGQAVLEKENWVVVAQDPLAGAASAPVVSHDVTGQGLTTRIALSVVYNETSGSSACRS